MAIRLKVIKECLSLKNKPAANKSILQVGLDVEASATNVYQQQFRLTNKAKQKFISSTFKTKSSCSTGLDIIKSPTCSNT
jgi:hypothetical protein